MDLVVRRRRARLGRRDRLHQRLWRRRHADRRALSVGVHRDRRGRADVRHHARARQRRSVAARQHRPRQRGGDEDHGRRRQAGRGRPAGRARLRARGRRRQLSPDLGAAHPADHRDAVGEFRHSVDRHLLWPRTADQAAARLRRLHQHPDVRRAAAGDPDGAVHPRRGRCAAANDLRPLRSRHRTEHPRRAAGGNPGRIGSAF